MLDRRGFLKMLVLAVIGLLSELFKPSTNLPTQAVHIDTDGPAQRFWFRLQNSPLSELERKQAYLNWVLNQPNIVLIEQGLSDKLFCEFVAERNHKSVDGEWKTGICGIGAVIGYSRHKFGDGGWTKWEPFYKE